MEKAMAENYDGKERRETENNTSLLIYRLGEVEEKVKGLDTKTSALTIDFTALKIELQNMAKNEGKLSGTIYGVGGAIVMTIITMVLQKVF
jgi:hypothetical protein